MKTFEEFHYLPIVKKITAGKMGNLAWGDLYKLYCYQQEKIEDLEERLLEAENAMCCHCGPAKIYCDVCAYRDEYRPESEVKNKSYVDIFSEVIGIIGGKK